MQYSSIPTKIPTIFASSAPLGNVTAPIPNSAQTGGFVSWPTGFQSINFTQVTSGGVPPWGKDFNGIFQTLSAWTMWFQAGGPIYFDQAYCTAIGGYPKGAVLQAVGNIGYFWINEIDNNIANPDAGGGNWFQFPNYPPPPVITIPPPPPASLFTGRLVGDRIFNTPGAYSYSPTAGVNTVVITMQGAGGAGGGTPVSAASEYAIGGGGGAGGILQWTGGAGPLVNTIFVVGSGGTPVSDGGGNAGSATTWAAIGATANGGGGGSVGFQIAYNQSGAQNGGYGGSAGGGNLFNLNGANGQQSQGNTWGNFLTGQGGNNFFGGGGGVSVISAASNGYNGAMGAGGSGSASTTYPGFGGGPYAGGYGGNGFVQIQEYT